MFDSTVTLDEFSALWLSREHPLLQRYFLISTSFVCLLVLATTIFSLTSRLIHRRAQLAAARTESSLDHATISYFNTCMSRADRAYFFFALVTLTHVLFVCLLDGYVSTLALSGGSTEDGWNRTFIIEVVLITVFYVALLIAAFVLVPMAQMVVATYLLAHAAARNPGRTLSHYLPQARRFASAMALGWSLSCLGVTVAWAPITRGVLRFVVLEAMWGSALAWLDASYAFNFHAKRLADKEVVCGNKGVRNIVAMFGGTALVAHGSEKEGLLPSYTEATISNEKCVVVEEQETDNAEV